MQSGFCTNCGRPLDAGAAFCTHCGARVETQTVPAASTESSAPFAAPARPPKNQSGGWVRWVVGCLTAFLAVIALLIGLLVFGLLTHQLIFFGIGLGGLVLLLLIGVAIEHLIRRLYRRVKYGIERDIGMVGRPYGAGPSYRSGARPYHQQPRFSLIRFLFSLAILAGLTYGGLYLYYSQQFVGNWSGVLTIGTAQQGIQANFQISVPLHSPSNPSFNDPPSLAVTQVQFKPVTLQDCAGVDTTDQLSGTASRLDASVVAMTLNTGKETIQLTGTYQNETFTLSGKNAAGQTVTLTLEKGVDQADLCHHL
jgi:hypothetical protein